MEYGDLLGVRKQLSDKYSVRITSMIAHTVEMLSLAALADSVNTHTHVGKRASHIMGHNQWCTRYLRLLD